MSVIQSQNRLNFFVRDTNPQATTSPTSSSSSSYGGKISPAILFIIVILAVIFFISGVLHLLVRFLMKRKSSSSYSISQSNRYTDNVSNSDTFQRQLQQLFHLHDSGLDQAFIDALPVFQYEEIVGLKEPFDCAVCLCEFSENDKLRLLPLCSHAFHIDCIDTWLLSNSTCPLCRGALYTPGTSFENPIFDFENLRDDDDNQKRVEIGIVSEKTVFPVRLGKFRSTGNETQRHENEVKTRDVGETSSSNLDARRCYSMGSYQYVVDESVLQVALCPKPKLISNGMVESKCLNGGRDGQNGNFPMTTAIVNVDAEARKINVGSKKESLSVSKIWLWSKKGKFSNESIHSNTNLSLPWTNNGTAS
ncbi:hypothetical protein RND81_11G023500 [Saponaria officinalis]|uniref:RING-type E3 ubiquitin transferase n=1 Tax=Saponaria officinalis TaxID=3572 RepID=A0AAW1HH87_SAPOF